MAIPDFQESTLPILQLAFDGEDHVLSDARNTIADRFRLTDADRHELLPSGRQGRFANRIAWAKVYLQQAGLLESQQRGHFSHYGSRSGSPEDHAIHDRYSLPDAV